MRASSAKVRMVSNGDDEQEQETGEGEQRLDDGLVASRELVDV